MTQNQTINTPDNILTHRNQRSGQTVVSDDGRERESPAVTQHPQSHTNKANYCGKQLQ